MDIADAFRNADIAPCPSTIGRNLDGARVVIANPFSSWQGVAVVHGQQPVPVVENDNGLTNENPTPILSSEHRFDRAPGMPMVLGDPAANEGGVLVAGDL